jgi:hypothetical protein
MKFFFPGDSGARKKKWNIIRANSSNGKISYEKKKKRKINKTGNGEKEEGEKRKKNKPLFLFVTLVMENKKKIDEPQRTDDYYGDDFVN